MTHGVARPPGSHELHEVEAADGRGDKSHRDLEGTEQTARHEVRQRQQHRSAPEGRQDAEPTRPLYISYAGFCLKKKKSGW